MVQSTETKLKKQLIHGETYSWIHDLFDLLALYFRNNLLLSTIIVALIMIAILNFQKFWKHFQKIFFEKQNGSFVERILPQSETKYFFLPFVWITYIAFTFLSHNFVQGVNIFEVKLSIQCSFYIGSDFNIHGKW